VVPATALTFALASSTGRRRARALVGAPPDAARRTTAWLRPPVCIGAGSVAGAGGEAVGATGVAAGVDGAGFGGVLAGVAGGVASGRDGSAGVLGLCGLLSRRGRSDLCGHSRSDGLERRSDRSDLDGRSA
jgi:hypothetical protein